jgi:O-antigen/teichoic acid export membrane protein
VPPMVFGSVAAPELVRLVLGEQWTRAVPVLSILAIAGARETVFQVTHSLMRAAGAGKLVLRYEIGATSCQLIAIVIGLHWGIVGVAVGFTVAGFVLTPVLMTIQRRLAGVTTHQQFAAIFPAINSSVWAAGGYLLVRLLDLSVPLTLLLGAIAYLLVGLVVLRLCHRSSWDQLVHRNLLPTKGDL